MQKPESVQEKEMQRIIRDFEIQRDHLIPGRRSDHVIINKQIKTKKEVKKKKNKRRNCCQEDFAVSADHKVKIKESKKIDKNLHFAKKLNNLWNNRMTVILTEVSAFGKVPKSFEKRLEELEIKRSIETIQDHQLTLV